MTSHDDSLSPPTRLRPEHDRSSFASGEVELDEWLRHRALANEASGASRTYVILCGGRVVAFYALAAGAMVRESATRRVRRNMPDPIPVMILGRLAVDRAFQGKGIGAGLLRDAILRTLQAAAVGGIRALLVHAISDEARSFYLHHGLAESPLDPMTLMVRLADAVDLS